MENVTVNKDLLITKVKANRAEHRRIFEDALAGYKAQAIELLEQHLAAIRSGKVQKVAVMLPQPEDHTRDYDAVITMLEMSVDKEIEIAWSDFVAYVMDDWSWKRQFLATNATYSAVAAAQLG